MWPLAQSLTFQAGGHSCIPTGSGEPSLRHGLPGTCSLSGPLRLRVSCGFICLSGVPDHTKHLLRCLFAIHTSSSVNCLFKSLFTVLLDCLLSCLVLWEFFIKSECKSFGRYEICKYFLSQQPVSSSC